LRPDCAACCGLCCVAPGFDAEQGFGYDKPPHQACRHLQGDYRCAIHPRLAAEGFPACSSYDCHGAGQRATREFAPDTWQTTPERAAAQHAAFMRLRPLHELLALLETARQRVADAAWQQRLIDQSAQIAALCAAAGSPDDRARSAALRVSVLYLLRELGRAPGVLALAGAASAIVGKQ
jgi:hypothetical protein